MLHCNINAVEPPAMPSVYDEPFAVRLPENPYAAALGMASPLWSLYAGAVTAGLGLWGVTRAASFGLTAERTTAAPGLLGKEAPVAAPAAEAPLADVAVEAEYWAVNPVEQGPGDPFAFDQSSDTAEGAADAEVPPAPSGKRKRRKASAGG